VVALLLTREAAPVPPMTGHLVTGILDYDGGRQVTAYVPPAPPEAVVFAGDGQLITSWGGVLEAAGQPRTMIIGVHRPDDETLRLREYSPGQSTAAFVVDPERFAAHEKFFTAMSAGGRNLGSASRCPPAGPRCAVSRPAQSSRSPWGCVIPASTARSCARRRGQGTGRRP
jgi:hypothetical protein